MKKKQSPGRATERVPELLTACNLLRLCGEIFLVAALPLHVFHGSDGNFDMLTGAGEEQIG